jgi:RNA polymerase sigma factor (sigma-70 family)
MDVNSLLRDFKPWLYKEAYRWASVYGRNSRDNDYIEDLAQEGWVAMWRSGQSFDPENEKGLTLRQCVLADARSRIKLCAARGDSLGQGKEFSEHKTQARVPQSAIKHVPDLGIESVDQDPDIVAALAVGESLDFVALAYHEGEIMKAINELSSKQRDVVYLRFWCGMTQQEINAAYNVDSYAVWHAAKQVLKVKLSHLASYREAGKRTRVAV